MFVAKPVGAAPARVTVQQQREALGLRPNSGKPKIGHPARRKLYNEDVIATVCAALCEGTPLAVVCREGKARDPEFPHQDTLRRWADDDDELASRLADARACGYDAIAHRTRKTARGLWPDEGGDSTGDVQRDRLVVDTDLKLLRVWDPARYGDRTTMEHTGKIGLEALVTASLPAAPPLRRTAETIDAEYADLDAEPHDAT